MGWCSRIRLIDAGLPESFFTNNTISKSFSDATIQKIALITVVVRHGSGVVISMCGIARPAAAVAIYQQ